MSEEKPGLHIDLDWKKQAQEEKRRLEEEEKRRADQRAAAAQTAPAVPVAATPPPIGAPAATPGAPGQGRTSAGRELPPASVQSLAQSLVTQALYYLGDMGARGGDEMTNMDMAKHLIDTLDVLETKTKGNLTPEEQQLLDTALC